jgi:hypothetical protein
MSALQPEQTPNQRPGHAKIRSLLLTKSPSKAQSTTTTTTTPIRSAVSTPDYHHHIDHETHANRVDIQTQPRKYHILTNAGKPVWSTEHEDENRPDGDLTSQMGLIQAVISIFEVDNNDQLRLAPNSFKSPSPCLNPRFDPNVLKAPEFLSQIHRCRSDQDCGHVQTAVILPSRIQLG